MASSKLQLSLFGWQSPKKHTARAERIKQALGMPHGTAFARLRKALMFNLAARLGLNFCFRCGSEIIAISELSVEHKIPWEGEANAIDLFFDLTNIAFSHLKCNVGAARKSNKIYADSRERSRVQWTRYYDKNGKEWNHRRNVRRRKIK